MTITDHKALVAEARSWIAEPLPARGDVVPAALFVTLVGRLADALEAATVERAVVGEPWLLSADSELSEEWSAWVADHDRLVEAQALEQAAEKVRYELGREASGHTSTYSVRNWMLARAVEIREGRQ